MQRIGVVLTYKGRDPQAPMNFIDVEEIVEYFIHNHKTQLAQFCPNPDDEDNKRSVDTLEFTMTLPSIKRLTTDLSKEGIQFDTHTATETITIDDDIIEEIPYTYITLEGYTLKLRTN